MGNPVIQVYSKEWCPYCAKSKALLRSKHLKFKEINVAYDILGDKQKRAQFDQFGATGMGGGPGGDGGFG